MRKLSKTFLLIGGIVAIICALICLGSAIGFFAISSSGSDETIKSVLQSYWSLLPGSSDAQKIEAAKTVLLGLGGAMIFIAIMAVPACVVSFMARSRKSAGLFVAAIILNVLAGSIFGILGGIFGLVANNQEKNQQPEVVDAQ